MIYFLTKKQLDAKKHKKMNLEASSQQISLACDEAISAAERDFASVDGIC